MLLLFCLNVLQLTLSQCLVESIESHIKKTCDLLKEYADQDEDGQLYLHTLLHPAGTLFVEMQVAGNALELYINVEPRPPKKYRAAAKPGTALLHLRRGGVGSCRSTTELTLPALPDDSLNDTVTVEGVLHCLLAARRQLVNGLSKSARATKQHTLGFVEEWLLKMWRSIPAGQQSRDPHELNVSYCYNV